MTASHTFIITALAAAAIVPGVARPACPTQAATEQRAAAIADGGTAAPYAAELSTGDAYCAQARYVARLTDTFGEKVGYKVAFTSDATQKQFGLSSPARGVLLADMLYASGATLPADFAARPLIEPDLLVTIADDAVMQADTPLEAARHLGEVRAFLELPALPLPADAGITGHQLIAFNAGARAGVQGEGTAVRATPAFIAALADMQGTLRDAGGEVLAEAGGDTIMGQPLHALLWLIEHLRTQGEKLRAGQVISLGSLAAPRPARPGRTYTLTYNGLPGGPLRATATLRPQTPSDPNGRRTGNGTRH